MHNKIYNQLKNGKKIELYYQVTPEISYTIRIEYKESRFYLHTFNFEGNDVFDESNYKNEKNLFFDSFEELHITLLKDFPNIKI